jgi:hypothetical protein
MRYLSSVHAGATGAEWALSGPWLSAHMVWSQGDETGVNFLPDIPVEKRGDEVEALRRRIRELERMVLKLQNRVQELSAS